MPCTPEALSFLKLSQELNSTFFWELSMQWLPLFFFHSSSSSLLLPTSCTVIRSVNFKIFSKLFIQVFFLSGHVKFQLLNFFVMQIINVYNQKYESAGAFWPHVHSRIIASLLISQFLLLGLLSTKRAANSTPILVMLPILTIWFHHYCKQRFEPAFRNYPLEVSPVQPNRLLSRSQISLFNSLFFTGSNGQGYN